MVQKATKSLVVAFRSKQQYQMSIKP